MTNDPKSLGSFRIADLRRPEVRSFTRGPTESPVDGDSESAGFPQIEARLESKTLEQVAEELRAVYAQLEQLAETGDFRQKGPARKAMAAYERTADLFEYLFQVRGQMTGEEPT
ncbi:MAG TPA: hypothetical protein RMG48_12385 [Myxococcales bacterium LLY-WYZ-16_1]|nr:hypothetical protein [Myxococcales bacterium LLY-WYZ-16_1]